MVEVLGERMENVEAKLLFDTFADTPKEVEAETLKYILADVMTKALIDFGLR